MKIIALLVIILSFSTAASAHTLDSVRGRLIKQITAPAHFVMFDKQHSDRAFIRDESSKFLQDLTFTVPETDCFLANHVKDDLQMTYEIRELKDTSGKVERLYYLLRLVSLKTGDDTKTWAAKESSDPELLARHHEQLRKVREE